MLYFIALIVCTLVPILYFVLRLLKTKIFSISKLFISIFFAAVIFNLVGYTITNLHPTKTINTHKECDIFEIDGHYIVYTGTHTDEPTVYIVDDKTKLIRTKMLPAQFTTYNYGAVPMLKIYTTTKSWFKFTIIKERYEIVVPSDFKTHYL